MSREYVVCCSCGGTAEVCSADGAADLDPPLWFVFALIPLIVFEVRELVGDARSTERRARLCPDCVDRIVMETMGRTARIHGRKLGADLLGEAMALGAETRATVELGQGSAMIPRSACEACASIDAGCSGYCNIHGSELLADADKGTPFGNLIAKLIENAKTRRH